MRACPERWGYVEGLSLRVGAEEDYTVDYDAKAEFSHRLTNRADGSPFGGAEGGYLLIRFDLDGEPCTAVDIDGPGGWWASDSGKAPADLVRRGADYLRAIADKLDKIDALE